MYEQEPWNPRYPLKFDHHPYSFVEEKVLEVVKKHRLLDGFDNPVLFAVPLYTVAHDLGANFLKLMLPNLRTDVYHNDTEVQWFGQNIEFFTTVVKPILAENYPAGYDYEVHYLDYAAFDQEWMEEDEPDWTHYHPLLVSEKGSPIVGFAVIHFHGGLSDLVRFKLEAAHLFERHGNPLEGQ